MMWDLTWEQWTGLWMIGSVFTLAFFHALRDPRGNDD